MIQENWIKKIAKADMVENRIRSNMIIVATIIIMTIVSLSSITYFSFLANLDRMIRYEVNFSSGFYFFMVVPACICGIFLVIDCFYLNRSDSIKQNGLLESVGMAGKQKRRVYRWQTFYLTSIGVLFSMVVIIPFTYFLLPRVVNTLVPDFEVISIGYILLIIIGAALLSIALVNTGLYISYYQSEQMTIVERLKYNESSYFKLRTKSNSKENSLPKRNYPRRKLNILFLAIKNFVRNIMNNSHVFVSLILALSMFLTVNVVLNGIDPITFANTYVGSNDYGLYNQTLAPNYHKDGSAEKLLDANVKSPGEDVFSDKMISEIKDIDNIENVRVIKNLNVLYDVNLKDDVYETSDCENYLNVVDTDYIKSYFTDENQPSKKVIEEFEKCNLAFVASTDYDDSQQYEIHEGGYVVPENTDDTAYTIFNENNRFDFSLNSIPVPMSEGNPELRASDGLFVHENYLDQISMKPITSSIEFSAEKKYRDKIQAKVDKIVDGDDRILNTSRDRYQDIAKGERQIVYLVGYMLSAVLVVVSFIGFIIVNIVSTDSRKREFFILNCVGMRKSDIKSMILSEGVIYGLVTILVMVLIANPIIYLIYSNFKVYYHEYNFPTMQFFISILLTMLIVLITPIITYKRVSKN